MESKRLTLYVDTSVIGGYFDIEFEKELACRLNLLLFLSALNLSPLSQVPFGLRYLMSEKLIIDLKN